MACTTAWMTLTLIKPWKNISSHSYKQVWNEFSIPVTLLYSVCTRQGGNRPCLGRTLRHPLASSQVLLQKVLLSSVSGLWEVPLRTRVPQMLYLGGAKVVLTKESTTHLCAPDQKSGTTEGPMEKSCFPPALCKSAWADGGRCCCLIDASPFWAPLLSQFRTLIPNSHGSQEADCPIFLLIRGPQALSCLLPRHRAAALLHHMRVTTVQGRLPPRLSPWTLVPGGPLITPGPLCWAARMGAGGTERWGLLEPPQGWEQTLLFPRILHSLHPSMWNKMQSYVYI